MDIWALTLEVIMILIIRSNNGCAKKNRWTRLHIIRPGCAGLIREHEDEYIPRTLLRVERQVVNKLLFNCL
jgi:hypothetical protein